MTLPLQPTASEHAVSAQQVDIPAAEGAIDSWIFQPQQSGRWPLVILHADIKGVRQTFIDHGRVLASRGFFVVLPNLYHRTGRAPVIEAGASFADEKSKERLAQLRNSLTSEGVRADHAAIFEFLASNAAVDAANAGIVGYCLSGAIALRAAADFPQRIKAAASFHGGRLASDAADSPHLRANEIKAQLYFGYAHDDASMTEAQIETLEQALKAVGVRFSSDHYAARHGFAVADSPSHDKAAADQHWQRITALFRSTLA